MEVEDGEESHGVDDWVSIITENAWGLLHACIHEGNTCDSSGKTTVSVTGSASGPEPVVFSFFRLFSSL